MGIRYDGTALGQNWQWGTTSIRDWFYVPIGNRVDVYFDNNISWGGSWQEATRQIYSNQRGYLLNVRERASTYRNYSGVYVQSSERITIFNNS